jgi:hypothetical protein
VPGDEPKLARRFVNSGPGEAQVIEKEAGNIFNMQIAKQ